VCWTNLFKQRSRELSRDPVPDHLRVHEAIAAGDPEAAAAAMRMLVDLALKDIRVAISD